MSALRAREAGTLARGILSKTSGFIAQAGFTHSLTPARNCTFGCTYCYVPTLRVYGGLKPEDWAHWGQFTTFKTNAAALLARELRAEQVIYCSPLTDPYQPAEAEAALMPGILKAVRARMPRMFAIQTRGPLILRDVELLERIPRLRVSFSLTTDDEAVRRLYEPHCAPMAERLAAMDALRAAGIDVFATLAPLLPCNPRRLMAMALEHSDNAILADPLHTRGGKARGATTREAALRISDVRGFGNWHEPEFQAGIVAEMADIAQRAGREFGTGPEGFRFLSGNLPGLLVSNEAR